MVSSIDKKIKKGQILETFFIIALTIFSMTLVGYFSFDNWVSTVIFGLGSGGIFGWVIDSFGKGKIK